MTLADIIAIITQRPAARTAAELRAALAEIDLTALERRVDDIESQRRALLLRGSDAELHAVLQDLTAANLDCERAAAAADELQRLIADADARETAAAIESRATAAQTMQHAIMRQYIDLDAAAAQLVELVAAIRQGEQELRGHNRFLSEQGCGARKIPAPLYALADHTGFSHQSLPQLDAWRLSGYLPEPAPARARVLGRMSELLPAPSRRAA